MFPGNKTHGILVPGGKTTSSMSDSQGAKGHEAAPKRETGSGPACLLIKLYLSFTFFFYLDYLCLPFYDFTECTQL